MISFTASHITFFFYILALIESVSLLCTVNEANKSIYRHQFAVLSDER